MKNEFWVKLFITIVVGFAVGLLIAAYIFQPVKRIDGTSQPTGAAIYRSSEEVGGHQYVETAATHDPVLLTGLEEEAP